MVRADGQATNDSEGNGAKNAPITKSYIIALDT